MSIELLIVLWGALSICFCAYFILGVALKFLPMDPAMRHLYSIGWWLVKWPALAYTPFSVTADIISGDDVSFLAALLFLANLVAWWWLRAAGDDDTLNKLKKKMTEKVIEVQGRLVTVPAGEPA